MFKGRTVRVNGYFAVLTITLFGAGAALFITHIANEIAENAETISHTYEFSTTGVLQQP